MDFGIQKLISAFFEIFWPNETKEEKLDRWINRVVQKAQRVQSEVDPSGELVFWHNSDDGSIHLHLVLQHIGRDLAKDEILRGFCVGALIGIDWHQAWMRIIDRLNQISRDDHRRLDARIVIRSTPERPMHALHFELASSVIVWDFRTTTIPNPSNPD